MSALLGVNAYWTHPDDRQVIYFSRFSKQPIFPCPMPRKVYERWISG